VRPHVIDMTGAVVHFERAGIRGGGAGGKTLCGRRFVPRVSFWSRDARLVRPSMESCPLCLELARGAP
jgi:hypothetical protein